MGRLLFFATEGVTREHNLGSRFTNAPHSTETNFLRTLLLLSVLRVSLMSARSFLFSQRTDLSNLPTDHFVTLTVIPCRLARTDVDGVFGIRIQIVCGALLSELYV